MITGSKRALAVWSKCTCPAGPKGPCPGLCNGANQLLAGTFNFQRVALGDGDFGILIDASDVDVRLGTPALDFVNITAGVGSFIALPEGIAGTFDAPSIDIGDGVNLTAFAAGLPGNISFSGIGSAIGELIDGVSFDLPGGPFFEIGLDIAAPGGIDVFGQKLSGNFELQRLGDVINFSVANGALGFTADALEVLTVIDANGSFNLGANGIVGDISGAVTITPTLPVSFEGNVSVAFDTMTGSEFVIASATDAALIVLGQRLSGNFGFQQDSSLAPTQVDFSATDVALAFGDGSNEIITASVASASLTLSETTLMATLTGASVAVSLPEVSLVGTFDVAINSGTTAAKGSIAASGTGISLKVAGQTLTGGIDFAQTADLDGDQVIFLALTAVSANLGGSGATLDVSNVTGDVLVTANGVAASITASLTATVTGAFSLSTAAARLDINTIPGDVATTFTGTGGHPSSSRWLRVRTCASRPSVSRHRHGEQHTVHAHRQLHLRAEPA